MELFFIISASTKRCTAIRQPTAVSVVVVIITCSSSVNDASGSRLSIIEFSLLFTFYFVSSLRCLSKPVAPKAL